MKKREKVVSNSVKQMELNSKAKWKRMEDEMKKKNTSMWFILSLTSVFCGIHGYALVHTGSIRFHLFVRLYTKIHFVFSYFFVCLFVSFTLSRYVCMCASFCFILFVLCANLGFFMCVFVVVVHLPRHRFVNPLAVWIMSVHWALKDGCFLNIFLFRFLRTQITMFCWTFPKISSFVVEGDLF